MLRARRSANSVFLLFLHVAFVRIKIEMMMTMMNVLNLILISIKNLIIINHLLLILSNQIFTARASMLGRSWES